MRMNFFYLALECLLLILGGVGAIESSSSDSEDCSPRSAGPWKWVCDDTFEEPRCVKKDANEAADGMTLTTCKLTCGKFSTLWPYPTEADIGKEVTYFSVDNIYDSLNCTGEVCNLLREAVAIFRNNLYKYYPSHSREALVTVEQPIAKSHELHLEIFVSNAESYLSLNTTEAYFLNVSTEGAITLAEISAETFFGARHALETLSQLVDYDESHADLQIITSATVTDEPFFSYRGIHMDTSRNYIPVENIKTTLDAMAANKLNTFHWHITDSHSFPMVIDSLPNMAYYGAYSSQEVYTAADIRDIVEYGRVRGIRTIPELDAPAHVGMGWEWGPKQGMGDLAVCISERPGHSYCVGSPCGQLNIANENMYEVLRQIYDEMADTFSPVELFHFGGDEVSIGCWNTTDEIVEWMIENGNSLDSDSYHTEWSNFQKRARDLLIEANKGKAVQGILWTSSLTDKASSYVDINEYIIQIWTSSIDPVIGDLLENGFHVIFSNYDAWYMDCGFGGWVTDGNNWCSPYKGWQTVYMNDPLKIAKNLTGHEYRSQIIGGEATLWSEEVDQASIDSRYWPRGSALAERLWSNPSTSWSLAETRMVHHRQRLVKRGIMADRLQPQWCHQNEGLCHL